jgi:N-acyl-D-aspartate/D-glutamate deacylase
MTDLVIHNGTVIDGTGAEPFEADVAIDGGRSPRSAKPQSWGRKSMHAACW